MIKIDIVNNKIFVYGESPVVAYEGAVKLSNAFGLNRDNISAYSETPNAKKDVRYSYNFIYEFRLGDLAL